jgi:hypothetical protein
MSDAVAHAGATYAASTASLGGTPPKPTKPPKPGKPGLAHKAELHPAHDHAARR